MERPNFLTQMDRLARTYGMQKYPAERTSEFWKVFARTNETVFGEAISEIIANDERAPMLQRLSEAVNVARARHQDRTWQELNSRQQAATPLEVLEKAAARVERKEFIDQCLNTLRRRIDRTLSEEHFGQACDLLAQVAAVQDPKSCAHCANSGYAIESDDAGYRFLYRCSCKIGRAKPEEFSSSTQGEPTRIPIRPTTSELERTYTVTQ